ncbi:suppressor of kinetochore protein mutant [Coemansia sp. RSA 552]|nr:suppressor of kinetochore protein mutant [Coemansia sp. RSA 552]
MIRLQASDGRLFIVDCAAAFMSTFIRNLVDDMGAYDKLIPVPDVTGPVLARVIEYCVFHKDDAGIADGQVPALLPDNNPMEAWDRRYMATDDQTILDVLYAADYLGIESLVDLACLAIARTIRHMPLDTIRSRYHVADDCAYMQNHAAQSEPN